MKSIAIKSLLACMAFVVVVVAAESYFRASGADRLLAVMEKLQPGLTKQEVRDLMGREPCVVPAGQAPKWIEERVPNKESGEFWYFFMMWPPRNLIIYFDANGKVSYTTWAPT